MRNIHLLLLSFVFPLVLSAQCPVANPQIPVQTCAGSGVNFSNTSTGAISHEWDFCPGDLNLTPTGQNLGNLAGFAFLQQIKLIKSNGNYYAFAANFFGNDLIRLDFGNSMNNTPVGFSYGALGVLNMPIGVDLINEGGVWYALVSNYGTNKISLVDLGSDISLNTASGTDLGLLNSSGPRQIRIKQSNGQVFAIQANDASSNKINIIEFGNSILNTPTVTSFTHTSFNESWGFDIEFDCTLNKYIGMVSNANSSNLTVLDFGPVINSNPTVIGTMISPIDFPAAIRIINDGGNYFVMGVGFDKLGRLSLGNSLTNTPVRTFDDSIANSVNPRGVDFIKEGSQWFGLISNAGNASVGKVVFPNPCVNIPEFSTDPNPSNVLFGGSGYHHISYSATGANGTSIHVLDSILVNELPSAQFTSSSACLGSPVQFSDQSSVSSGQITNWLWDFGDTNTSTLQNPDHTYLTAGQYTVTLTVTTAANCSNDISSLIDVAQTPNASFTFMNNTCAGEGVFFTDQSVANQGSILTWNWDFGDTNTSQNQNPAISYATSGTYTVNLIVTTDLGCLDSVKQNITILPTPLSSFSVLQTCINDNVIFNNTSTISGSSISGYIWDFGDSGSSTLNNPTHIYPAVSANYTVVLIANAANGCSDTLSKIIHVSNRATPVFSVSPANICKGNAASFNDMSVISAPDTINSWFWDFGDNTNSTLKNPTHSYANTGTYTVTLTVSSLTSCDSTTSQQVNVIDAPVAGFSVNDVCQGMGNVFNDLSMPASGSSLVSWAWDFGDSNTSNQQNPMHTYASSGSFTAGLTVTDNFGCMGIATQNAIVHPLPLVNFGSGIKCTGSPVQFTDSTLIFSGSITSWLWDFGDPGSGTSNISTLQNPTHLYNTQGFYFIKLKVTSDEGCVDSLIKSIEIRKAPSPNFSASQACDGEYVQFTYLPNPFPSTATNWAWSFGNGITSTQTNPANLYLTYGNYNVSLTVTDSLSGCVNSLSQLVLVDPIPVARIGIADPCIGVSYQFKDSSSVATGNIASWNWDFGGLGTSTQKDPIFAFADTGSYIIKLIIVSDKGCTHQTTRTITVTGPPTAKFIFNPTFGGVPLLVNFNNQSINAVSYFWNFGDANTSALANPSHTYQDTGRFTITLYAYTAKGCVDSTTKSIYVIQPRLDIAVLKAIAQKQGDYLTISSELFNVGTREVTSMEIIAEISNGSTVREQWTGILLPGESMIYTFNSSYQLKENDDFNFICIRTSKPNGETDNNPINNRKCQSLINDFVLFNPYPNPSNGIINIQFNLGESKEVSLQIFSKDGKLIKQLFTGNAAKGLNSKSFDISELAVGSYRIVLRSQEEQDIKQLFKY